MNLNTNRNYIVGVDLGGTNVRAAVSDLTGKLYGDAKAESYAMEGTDRTIPQIIQVIRDAVSNTGITMTDVAGIGMGVPGQHISDQGVVLWSPNFSLDWAGFQLLQPISNTLGIPAFMGNDVNVAALGEYKFGAGKGSKVMVMLTLGTGIGGGIIIDGRIWLGVNEGGGEIGHQVIEPGGRRCGCGSFGCLEAMAQRDAIIDYAHQELQKGRESILLDLVDDRKDITPAVIAEAAAKGDRVSLDVWEKVGNYVGIGVTNCVNILNPDCVVIGGGIAEAGEPLWGPIQRTVENRVIEFSLKIVKVVPAALGDNAGIMGGVALAMQKLGL